MGFLSIVDLADEGTNKARRELFRHSGLLGMIWSVRLGASCVAAWGILWRKSSQVSGAHGLYGFSTAKYLLLALFSIARYHTQQVPIYYVFETVSGYVGPNPYVSLPEV